MLGRDRQHRSQSGRFSASGFSMKTCLPAFSTAIAWSACSVVGVTSTMASRLGSAMKASKSLYSRSEAMPSSRPAKSRSASTGLHAATRSTWRVVNASASAWRRPSRPRPAMPTRKRAAAIRSAPAGR